MSSSPESSPAVRPLRLRADEASTDTAHEDSSDHDTAEAQSELDTQEAASARDTPAGKQPEEEQPTGTHLETWRMLKLVEEQYDIIYKGHITFLDEIEPYLIELYKCKGAERCFEPDDLFHVRAFEAAQEALKREATQASTAQVSSPSSTREM